MQLQLGKFLMLRAVESCSFDNYKIYYGARSAPAQPTPKLFNQKSSRSGFHADPLGLHQWDKYRSSATYLKGQMN
jgi:hypothetical protein